MRGFGNEKKIKKEKEKKEKVRIKEIRIYMYLLLVLILTTFYIFNPLSNVYYLLLISLLRIRILL